MGARRRSGGERRQKGKGKKRGSGWHSGRAQGRVNERILRDVVEPTFALAAAVERERREEAERLRSEIADFRAMIESLGRVAPALYAPFRDLGGIWETR